MWLHLLLSLGAMALLSYCIPKSWALTLTVVAAVLLLGAVKRVLSCDDTFRPQCRHEDHQSLTVGTGGARMSCAAKCGAIAGFSAALVLLLTILALRQDLLNEWQNSCPKMRLRFPR